MTSLVVYFWQFLGKVKKQTNRARENFVGGRLRRRAEKCIKILGVWLKNPLKIFFFFNWGRGKLKKTAKLSGGVAAI